MTENLNLRVHDQGDVERQILGSLLLDPDSLERVGDTVEASDFASTWNAKVWRVVRAVIHEGGPPEAVSGAVIRNLATDSRLPRADVANDINGMMFEVVAVSLVDHHATTLKRQAQTRRILHEAAKLQKIASAGHADGERMRESINRLADLALGVDASTVTSLSDAAAGHADRLEKLAGDNPPRFITGLSVFDSVINATTGGGLQGGQLGLIGGRTGSGKTTLAAFVAAQVADFQPSARVHIFSLELDPRVLAAKAIARAIFDPTREDTRSAHEKARAGADAIRRDFGDRITVSEEVEPSKILATAARLGRDGVDLFVLDHIHRVRVRDFSNIRHELGDFTVAMRDHAKTWDVPWLVACQLGRDSMKKATAPGLEDVSESDKIVQEADWAVTLWYPNRDNRAECELNVCKNRTGPEHTERVRVNWAGQSFATFSAASRRGNHG